MPRADAEAWYGQVNLVVGFASAGLTDAAELSALTRARNDYVYRVAPEGDIGTSGNTGLPPPPLPSLPGLGSTEPVSSGGVLANVAHNQGNLLAAEVADSAPTLSKADFPEIATEISQKQLRHIDGRQEYRGGGYLSSSQDAKIVLDAYHDGTAQILGKTPDGFPVVRVDSVTGTNVNVGAGYPNQLTNVFIIKGTVKPSIVPTNPNWKAR